MIRLLAVIPGLALAACSMASDRPTELVYVDEAEVIRVEPLYKEINVARPVNRCWREPVMHITPSRAQVGATLAGGVIGGVIGRKLGRGRGRTPLTVAGVLAGAAIGRGLSQPAYVTPGRTSRDVQRCTTVKEYDKRQEVVGYSVDYRYAGQIFTTQTLHHPGRHIRMHVHVDPVDGG